MAQRGDRTRQKLEEARFFLGQLRANYGKLKKFDYFVSAYISSARSVTWVMKNEYGKVPGWKSWYESKQATKEEAALLKGTNQVRVRAEKIEPLKTDSTFIIGVGDAGLKSIASLAQTKGKKVVKLAGTSRNPVLEFEIADQRFSIPVTEVRIERRLAEFPDKNILKVCEHYYRTIEAIVDECGKKFDA